MEPLFLSVDEVLELHREATDRYGGSAGIRDTSLLESAVFTPAQSMGGHYLHRSIPQMAAAYLFHIVSNHPFIDGNKRTGAFASEVFLDMNGWTLDVDDDTFEALVRGVAAGQFRKERVIEFFERYARPSESEDIR